MTVLARGLPRYRDARAVAAALRPSYPVYCLAPEVIGAAARRFLEAFPGRVLYAVKCNPHPRVLAALHDAGIRHFDSASLPEIALVRERLPGAEPYFMHPVKSRAVIATAHEVYGVRHFAVDHPAELDKVLAATGGEGIAVIVRLKTAASGALYNLASKFGAEPEAAAALLRRVKREGLVAGLCFHVGSQCLVPEAWREALALCARVLEQAGVGIGFLDLGGGFPARYPGLEVPDLEAYLEAIRTGLAGLALRNDCVLMCEPGRALVADGCSLLTQVLLRKEREAYLNDGVFGSLSELVTARIRLPVRVIRLDGEPSRRLAELTLYGPTCDSADRLPGAFRLPEDLREGDWIEFGRIGAYSNAVATRFNGFFPETFVEVDEVFPAPG